MNNQDKIHVTIILDGEEHRVLTFRSEYRSLMTLIRDKLYPDDFGECGGMGRCATCQVKVSHAREMTGMERNESSTLAKAGVTDPLIRLSCQLHVDASLDEATVII